MAKIKNFHKVDIEDAKKRVKKIYPILKKTYPQAECSLDFRNPLELLIATILAAQCTDARVNIVTKDLFEKYKSAKDWIDVPLEELQEDIRTTGFYRNKAKNIQKTCQSIIEDYNSEVPSNMEDLLKLGGVGRKTANVLLGDAFDVPGIVCDTHMIRQSRRFGFTENSDPTKIEFDLMEIIPKRWWTLYGHLMVFHGRAICKAPKPKCQECPIKKHCPSADMPEMW